MPASRLYRKTVIEGAKLVNLAAQKAGGLEKLAEITGYQFDSLVNSRNKNLVSRKLEKILLNFIETFQTRAA